MSPRSWVNSVKAASISLGWVSVVEGGRWLAASASDGRAPKGGKDALSLATRKFFFPLSMWPMPARRRPVMES